MIHRFCGIGRVSGTQAISWAGVCFAVLIVSGCGSSDSDTADLLRKKQLQQQQQPSTTQNNSVESRLAEAEKLFGKKRYGDARAILVSMLVDHADNPDVLKLAARCEAALGNTPAAVEFIDRSVSLDPDSEIDSQWLASQWLVDTGDYAGAEKRLESVLEQKPDLIRVHRRLANLLNNQGKRIHAAEHLRALAKSGEISERELLAMVTYSQPFIDTSLPPPSMDGPLRESALAMAKRLHVDKQVREAAELTRQLAKAFPESAPIAAFHGRVLSDLLDDAGLEQWVRDLPAGMDREPEYWSALGSWMQRQGKHREACRCFLEAIRLDETDRFSMLALAGSFDALDMPANAKQMRERFGLLQELADLYRTFGKRKGEPEELERAEQLLFVLDRPFEALAWRKVALGATGTETQRNRLEEERLAFAAARSSEDSLRRTLGLEIDDWPLPEWDSFAEPKPNRIAEENPASATRPIVLTDVSEASGFSFQYHSGDDPGTRDVLLHQLTGGGISVIDYDRDGHPDVYLGQSGGPAFDDSGSDPNVLFRNQSGTTFENRAAQAGVDDTGYGQGAGVGDLNQDGFPDLVVANIGHNIYFRNNGDGTFTKMDVESAKAFSDWTISIAMGDLSGDHLPEILEVNYVDDPTALEVPCTPESHVCNPSHFRPAADRVLSVAGDGQVGLWEPGQNMSRVASFGFGAVISNFDADAGNDVFIANDVEANYFWRSREDGQADHFTLTESAQIAGCGYGLAGARNGCMGIAAGDFDRNGWMDLHVTNFWNQPADLYLLQAGGIFTNANAPMGMVASTQKTVGWGTQAVDLNRDGWLDLPVLNGHVINLRSQGIPFQMDPQLFLGTPDRFVLADPESLESEYFGRAGLGRALAIMDWNSDLKPDLVAGDLTEPTRLLENRTQGGHAIRFELIGTSSERDAIGAKITVDCGTFELTHWRTGGDGFLANNQNVIDFGLGATRSPVTITVQWPSGQTGVYQRLEVDRSYLIVEGSGQAFHLEE